jgi:glutaredoxin-related protein
MNVQERIRNQVTENSIVLYMKGTPQFPQCGFSGATVQLLKACGAQDFTAVDVLADPEVRLQQLADRSAALHQGRICRWCRYCARYAQPR